MKLIIVRVFAALSLLGSYLVIVIGGNFNVYKENPDSTETIQGILVLEPWVTAYFFLFIGGFIALCYSFFASSAYLKESQK